MGMYSAMINCFFFIGYNFYIKASIHTFLETINGSIQTVVLIIMHWHYNPSTKRSLVIGSIIFFVVSGIVLMGGIMPNWFYDNTIYVNMVLVLTSGFPQIKANFDNKSTGQLAILPYIFAFVGNSARVFTTIQEVQDMRVLILYLMLISVQGIILLQFWLYWDNSKSKTQVDKTK